MPVDAALRAELEAFARSRPESVQALMREWPPGATVKTKPGVVLLVPAPGVEGTVGSYFEDGKLGIAAPASIPHPKHGFGDAAVGEMLSAAVDPTQLVLVREDVCTRDDVAAALA